MSATAVERDDKWSMHDAFDADIGVSVAETGLYLVVAHDDGRPLQGILARVGAQLVAAISDRRVLAIMQFAAFQQLHADAGIRLIGPVALDSTRFGHFQRLIGAGVDA